MLSSGCPARHPATAAPPELPFIPYDGPSSMMKKSSRETTRACSRFSHRPLLSSWTSRLWAPFRPAVVSQPPSAIPHTSPPSPPTASAPLLPAPEPSIELMPTIAKVRVLLFLLSPLTREHDRVRIPCSQAPSAPSKFYRANMARSFNTPQSRSVHILCGSLINTSATTRHCTEPSRKVPQTHPTFRLSSHL